jgi:hypothetical protein
MPHSYTLTDMGFEDSRLTVKFDFLVEIEALSMNLDMNGALPVTRGQLEIFLTSV